MIIPNAPAPKEEPFTFVRPQLPARPFTDSAELEANRDSLLPAAQAFTATDLILQHAATEADRIGRDTNLTAQGKRTAFTDGVAKSALPKLREHLAKLDAAGAVVQAEAEALQKAATVPEATERHDRLAEAFGRRTEQQRLRLLEGAMTGKDDALAEALAYAHPILHGLGAGTVAILRGELEGGKLDPEAVERVRSKAEKVGTVRRALTSTIDAMERAADSKQLKEAGVATVRRSDLTQAEKIALIESKGLAAFKKLL